MKKQKSKATTQLSPVKCGECGNDRFIRIGANETTVILFRDGLGILEREVSQEGTEYQFICAACDTSFEEGSTWKHVLNQNDYCSRKTLLRFAKARTSDPVMNLGEPGLSCLWQTRSLGLLLNDNEETRS